MISINWNESCNSISLEFNLVMLVWFFRRCYEEMSKRMTKNISTKLYSRKDVKVNLILLFHFIKLNTTNLSIVWNHILEKFNIFFFHLKFIIILNAITYYHSNSEELIMIKQIKDYFIEGTFERWNMTFHDIF